MPNYCNNTVKITADKATIKRIEQSLKTSDNDGFLNCIHPMPTELKDTVAGSEDAKPEFQKKQSEQLIEKYGFDNWYDWRVENWGTKWEVNECYGDPVISDNGETIEFGFDTAWSPATGAYHYFLSENPNASLFATYYEPGCDFMGVWDSGDDRCYCPGDYDSEDDFWTTEDDGILLNDNYGIVESKQEWEAEQEAEQEDVTEYVKGNARNLDKLHIGEDA
jgi:hypothetical protein